MPPKELFAKDFKVDDKIAVKHVLFCILYRKCLKIHCNHSSAISNALQTTKKAYVLGMVHLMNSSQN